MTEQVLSAAAVGAHLGNLASGTILRYLWESAAPGRRYSHHPFPAPTGYVSRSPYWTVEQLPELEAWLNGRKGRGSGGGQKRRNGNHGH